MFQPAEEGNTGGWRAHPHPQGGGVLQVAALNQGAAGAMRRLEMQGKDREEIQVTAAAVATEVRFNAVGLSSRRGKEPITTASNAEALDRQDSKRGGSHGASNLAYGRTKSNHHISAPKGLRTGVSPDTGRSGGSEAGENGGSEAGENNSGNSSGSLVTLEPAPLSTGRKPLLDTPCRNTGARRLQQRQKALKRAELQVAAMAGSVEKIRLLWQQLDTSGYGIITQVELLAGLPNTFPSLDDATATARAWQQCCRGSGPHGFSPTGGGGSWVEEGQLALLLRSVVSYHLTAVIFEGVGRDADRRLDFAEFQQGLSRLGMVRVGPRLFAHRFQIPSLAIGKVENAVPGNYCGRSPAVQYLLRTHETHCLWDGPRVHGLE